jgi:ABC-type branched-subunit amino acid transport system substrate-binding protein
MRVFLSKRPGVNLAAALCLAATGAMAQGDDAPAPILFGQSAALTGPAAALGQGMQAGILAAFDEVNRAGGVNGRQLELISLDDGYEPEIAIANTETLIGEDNIFALIGEVGTPTSLAVQSIAAEAGVPVFGPLTGAGFLREAAQSNVINIRASYDQEAEAWVAYLTGDLDLSRIAVLYQDDSYGRSGLAGVEAALARRGMKLVSQGSYKRNTIAIKRAVLAIRKGKPQAVIIVGAYAPAAEFIRVSRSIGLTPLFANISFVGARALAANLGISAGGVMISQVTPSPDDETIPLVANYRAALARSQPLAEPGFVSLEGYMVGRFVATALEAAGPEATRESLLATIRTIGQFDLGGVTLTFGPDDNQGMDEVFLTVIGADGAFGPVTGNAQQ